MSRSRRPFHFIPEDRHTITPRIVILDAQGLVALMKYVFGGTRDCRPDGPALLRIGDSVEMISDVSTRRSSPAFLYVYVETLTRSTNAPPALDQLNSLTIFRMVIVLRRSRIAGATRCDHDSCAFL